MAEPQTTTPAPDPKEISQPETLRVVAPINYEVLRRMEFRAGRDFTMAESEKAMQTPEFTEERHNVHYEFCAQPRKERVRACEEVTAFRLGNGFGQAPARSVFREAHFQGAKSSAGCSATTASAVAASYPDQ